MVANAAQQQVDKATAHRRHDYQVNFAQALSKMKNTLVELKPLRKCVDNLCITAMIVLIPLNIRATHVKDKIMCRLGW
jgi:hypothetical protein